VQNQFNHHVESRFSFLKEKKLLLAVSGGLDSMVLLYLLNNQNFDITVAHCNFQLRDKESDEDEAFVVQFCQDYNIKYFTKKFDTEVYATQNKLSIQVAARTLRYDWFKEIMVANGLDFLLTAHHLDDAVETFLINFTRGCGLDGLTGIPECNGNIIRLLLPFSRLEIYNFAIKNNIAWREDSSNSSDKYFRNKLRHQVVPVLKELNTSFLETFQNTILHLQESQEIVNQSVEDVKSKICFYENDLLKINIPKLLQYKSYKTYLYHILKPFHFFDWTAIYNLLETQSGKMVYAQDFFVLKDRNLLIVSKILPNENKSYFVDLENNTLNFPFEIRISNTGYINSNKSNSIFVDYDLLKFPLEIRKWKEGDVFYPIGMKGKKKLGKYFKDEKMSLIEKLNQWVLISDNQIVWIISKRQDDRFKITEKTNNKLQIIINNEKTD